MASWTDQIPQFNPYISQLPVEAMVTVGMEKQKRYDEGVQKIQSEIDKVAGLDIVRDIDRQYLQSKLNELGNNLRTVAAGDFSNYQLVNSVGGMAKQVSQDKYVQDAVVSTKKYRRGQEELDAAKKDGKSSPQNEAWWNNQVSDWLNNTNVGTSFNGQYVPYTDVTKKWMEIQKELGVSEVTRDLPFYQDAYGRYTDAKGNLLPEGAKPVLNDVMVETTMKGKSPQAIKEAIMTSLNETDLRQLNIDAWYHYRNVSPDGLKSMATSDHNEYIKGLDDQLKNLETLKQLNPSNAGYQDAIAKKIEDIKTDYANSVKEYENIVNQIDKDPDRYKSIIYTQKAINQFSTAFSSISDIQKIVDNPYLERLDKERTYKLAVDTYLETQRHHKATEEVSWANYQLEVLKNQQSTAAKDALFIPGSLQIPNLKDLEEKITFSGFRADLKTSKEALTAEKKRFKNIYFKDKSDAEFEKEYAFHLKNYSDGVETSQGWVQLFDQIGGMQKSYDDNAALLISIQNEVDNLPEFKGTRPISQTQEQLAKRFETAKQARELGLAFYDEPPRGAVFADPIYAKKLKKVEEILQQRLIQTYRPEAFSFQSSSNEQKDFVKNAFSQYLTKITVSKGKQEKTPLTKDFNLGSATELNTKPSTRYGFIRSGNKIYLTMQGEIGEGKDATASMQVIETDVAEFSRVFKYSPTSPVQQVSDDLFKFGNTNPQSGSMGFTISQNPNAYKTARFSKIRGGSSSDAFPMVNKYSIKADFVQLPYGGYQALFYIQDPISQTWKSRLSDKSNDLNALKQAFNYMNDATVESLLK